MDESARAIARKALTALLEEVAVAPKPGLVCPSSRGSHDDMDYFTFLASASALAPWFERFARIGIEGAAATDPSAVFPELRKAGRDAEAEMFEATGGVNTHKGLIFSFGLLCASAGILAARGVSQSARACAETASRISRGVTRADFHGLDAKPEGSLSAGERLYLRRGVGGIRSEAERGYPSVLEYSLPRFRADLASGLSRNEALANALIVLFSVVEDTNVLARGGPEGLSFLRKKAERALSLGGITEPRGRRAILRLDRELTARNLSPGGCADLLAVTSFLERME